MIANLSSNSRSPIQTACRLLNLVISTFMFGVWKYAVYSQTRLRLKIPESQLQKLYSKRQTDFLCVRLLGSTLVHVRGSAYRPCRCHLRVQEEFNASPQWDCCSALPGSCDTGPRRAAHSAGLQLLFRTDIYCGWLWKMSSEHWCTGLWTLHIWFVRWTLGNSDTSSLFLLIQRQAV